MDDGETSVTSDNTRTMPDDVRDEFSTIEHEENGDRRTASPLGLLSETWPVGSTIGSDNDEVSEERG